MAQSLASAYTEKFIKNQSYSITDAFHINGGIAVSSQYALDCLQDSFRTQFQYL